MSHAQAVRAGKKAARTRKKNAWKPISYEASAKKWDAENLAVSRSLAGKKAALTRKRNLKHSGNVVFRKDPRTGKTKPIHVGKTGSGSGKIKPSGAELKVAPKKRNANSLTYFVELGRRKPHQLLTKEDVLKVLPELMKKYGVSVSIVGSVGKKGKSHRDLDLQIGEKIPGGSVFIEDMPNGQHYLNLHKELETKLNMKVDLCPKGDVKGVVLARPLEYSDARGLHEKFYYDAAGWYKSHKWKKGKCTRCGIRRRDAEDIASER